MDLFPRSFDAGLIARLTGPGKARFIVQPLVAIVLGARDGIADAKQGKSPYIIRILFKGEHKLDVLETSLRRIAVPLTIGLVLDMILQWVMFALPGDGTTARQRGEKQATLLLDTLTYYQELIEKRLHTLRTANHRRTNLAQKRTAKCLSSLGGHFRSAFQSLTQVLQGAFQQAPRGAAL